MSCDDVGRSVVAAAGLEDVLADRAARDHLRGCPGCRALLLSRGLAGDALARGPITATGACLSTESLAGFLDGSLGPDARAAASDHLVGCDACLREALALADDLAALVGTGELARPAADLEARAGARAPATPRTARPWSARLAIPLAAAAALGLLAIGLGLRDMGLFSPAPVSGSPELLRGEEGSGLHLDGPRGEVPGETALRFSWTAAGGGAGARYRLTVAQLATGRVVLEVEVDGEGRELTAAEMAVLTPGERYHWIVTPLSPVPGEPSEAVGFTLR